MVKPFAMILGMVLTFVFAHAFSGEPVDRYPLHTAARHDDVQAIQRLLSAGGEIDARDQSGSTALLLATRENKVAAAKALIDAGADVNAKDNINDSAYLYAGARGHLEILNMTLAHGADLTSTNRYGGTALIPAAERGHVDTVRTLVDAGVDVDHINKLGWTALLEAIILGSGGERHQKIVDILLKAGANPNLADRDGVTPLQHARKHGYHEIERSLLAAGGR
ncbi:ankyrin repeat domain-containing protein [Pusillimonas sp. TS35]|uniref:ankyrin repeat domain-containing protein n=1 Tax=Paracandidimonas lactea TaxID=2895524 RepID=UPI00136EBD54|nr:ankyrin repeat domain-containing protein [Paracandidimonas lactea]MYN12792.1 ankyrin repeat domain-containing protein [Pusillimonas sp. TS35]